MIELGGNAAGIVRRWPGIDFCLAIALHSLSLSSRIIVARISRPTHRDRSFVLEEEEEEEEETASRYRGAVLTAVLITIDCSAQEGESNFCVADEA